MMQFATSSYILAMTGLAVVVIAAMTTVGASFVVSWKRSKSAADSLATVLRSARERAGTNSEADDATVLAAIQRAPLSVLASNKELRQQVFELWETIPPTRDEGVPTQFDHRRPSTDPSNAMPPSQQTTTGRVAFSDKPYATIASTLARVPRTIPLQAENPPQKACLETLAEELGLLREPFRSWSKSLERAARALASVVPMEKKLQALLATALRAKTHFDIDFYEAVTELRERAQDRDQHGCSEAIEKLATSVVSWVDLTNDWYSLRQDAAASMSYSDNTGSEWKGSLRHIAVNFREPGTGRPMVWWQSSLLYQWDSLQGLSSWIIREIDDRIKDRKWKADFTAICSMSSTGVPLATLLSSHYRKRFLIVDEDADYNFPPGFEPRLGDKIVLVDSNISTGFHLAKCTARIKDAKASVTGAVFITENDLSEGGRLFEDDSPERDRIIPLFTLGAIYRSWKEEGTPRARRKEGE